MHILREKGKARLPRLSDFLADENVTDLCVVGPKNVLEHFLGEVVGESGEEEDNYEIVPLRN